jgi:fido (protein-threonine AMPylation protein)
MATIAAVTDLQLTDPCISQNAGNDQGRDTSPNGDVLMEQILENINTTPQEEVLKRIASLPDIRLCKVLNIHRQLTEGTYEVAGRLDRAIDRVLEAITA